MKTKITAIPRHALALVGPALWISFFATHAQAVTLEPPEAVGALRLVHALRGKEALQAIDRLHGRGLAGTDAYVAHYKRDGFIATPYASRPASASMTEAQIEKMVTGIRAGKTPFHHPKASERDGTTVYSALGEGQIHYFYRRGADLTWIAADPLVAREVLESVPKRDP